MQTVTYESLVCPKEIRRTKTPSCVANAREALFDYLHYGMITEEDFNCAIVNIKKAKHDDEISCIMHRINRNLLKMN